MKKFLVSAMLLLSLSAAAENHMFTPTDPHIQYVGRISFKNPERLRFSYPGTQINVAFEGTMLRMRCKPGSGYFMAQIDQSDPFKVAFRGPRDSVVTLCTALAQGRHVARLMYCNEGYEYKPEFWGVITDGKLVDMEPLPAKKFEFVGNSITCGYGNEGRLGEPFLFETENHYYGYAQLTMRRLGAVASIIARSGIGAYRNYGEPKTGSPGYDMPAQYENTLYNDQSERWDFSRWQPDVVCINLGTNDLSTQPYDTDLLKQGYKRLLGQVRKGNPKAKVVFLCGPMLYNKELDICKQILNEVTEEAHKAGDKQVYRFDFTPMDGSLGYGSDWHPSMAQHQKMADELTPFLQKLMEK
jgi:lysophospholipase L1-like esterase